jgi:transcriptional regulator with XRE-family HTH domain
MLRIQRGLSLEAFSDVVEKRFLSKVELGKTSPSLRSVTGIAELLQISVSNLMLLAQAAATESDPIALLHRDQQALEAFLKAKVILRPIPGLESLEKGLKGRRGEELRSQIRECQGKGMTKAETIRQLKVGRSTVNRHWAGTDLTSNDLSKAAVDVSEA